MPEKGKRFKMPDPLFSAKFLQTLAEKAKNEYRKITFDKASPKMANGQSFPKYSKGYEKQKKSGRIGSKKKGFTHVSGGYQTSTAPFVRGDLHNDTTAGHSVSKSAIYIGWTSHANKIDWLRDMKPTRILTSKSHPINPKILDKIMPEFNKEYKRIMPKGTHTITIGKKRR